ncbi:O-antigen ligase family protein [Mycobacterium sp. C31M]
MPDPILTFAVCLVSGIAVLITILGVVSSARRGEWTSAAYLSLGLALLTFSFLNIVITYAGAWVSTTDVYNTVTNEMPDWGTLGLRVMLVVQALAAVAVIILRLRRGNQVISIPAAFLSIVALISIGTAFLRGEDPLRPFTIIYVLILFACIVAPRGIGIHLGIAIAGLIQATASGFAMWLHPDIAVNACEAGYKCGLLGFNLPGVMDNENALAISLVIAMPFVYMAFRGWQGVALTLYIAGIVVLTGSRSGALAAMITLAALLIVRPDARNPSRAPGRSVLAALGLFPLLAVSLFLPFLTRDPSAFTGRGGLWALAQEELGRIGPLLHGNGVFGWDSLRDIGKIDASEVYSAHNQWLSVAFSTGLVGVTFFTAAIVVLLWQARNTYFPVVCCVLVPVAVLSITERPWPIDTADWLTWAVPGALLCYPLTRPSAPKPQTAETRTQTTIKEEVLVP